VKHREEDAVINLRASSPWQTCEARNALREEVMKPSSKWARKKERRWQTKNNPEVRSGA
jgi:hypothetical protein